MPLIQQPLATVAFPLNTDTIASLLKKDRQNVTTNWPLIVAALEKESICSLNTQIAAIATVAVETWGFAPIREWGNDAYLSKYDNNTQLGNTQPGDGVRYCGRGFVQLTGRYNYGAYGKALGIDLLAHPELALDAKTAAAILAYFFKLRRIPDTADSGDWTEVRKLVNGGTNGLQEFLNFIQTLKSAFPH